ncbi:Hypothetical protein, putative [Bodo saltans]|nr:Hypothetical protein, putative [Bodo saltans]|eukprot:CUI14185.1 Hypothetical protein, putative [Bodo saltans]
MQSLTLTAFSLSDVTIAKLRNLMLLERLDVTGCVISGVLTFDECVHHLTASEGLRTLILDHCSQLTDVGIGRAMQHGPLRELSIVGCTNVTSPNAVTTINSSQLLSINIQGSGLSVDAVATTLHARFRPN